MSTPMRSSCWPPNPRLQRTPLRAPLSRKPLGDLNHELRVASWFFSLALLAVTFGCATSRVKPISSASLTAERFSPTPGSTLAETSVVTATLEFSIANFVAGPGRYYLLIQFEATDGSTFNHYDSFADSPELKSAVGTVKIEYAMSNIWHIEKLRRPIRVWFYLVERTEPHETVVIGRSGPFQYAG
jgi:hypothetical protein